MKHNMSKLEEKLVALITKETGSNVTFKRMTSTIFKIIVAGNHEMYLDDIVMKFSQETDIYFDEFHCVHDGESRTVVILTHPNKEQYYLSLLREANDKLNNYNNMYGDIEAYNETNFIKLVEEVL
jgi:serine/threonine protein phosphatase PrpC